MKYTPYGRHFIDKKDISNVVNVLKKEKITTGNEVKKFETKLTKFFGSKFTTVCNSGTSALYLAFLAIGLKKNDKVVMPAINFVASYNVVKNFGAKVFLADVDKFTGQMSPTNVIRCCKKYKLKKIKAILTMYNGGYPQNAENFYKLKKKYKCFIVEDACHALGAEYLFKNSRIKIGSCKHSDISTFSLHPLKSITTGEGGVVTTNSKLLDHKLKRTRSLGIDKKTNKHWEYDVIYNGFNFRLTDFQCALGISQLTKLNLFLRSRKAIASRYSKELKKIPKIFVPNYESKYISSYHLYIINFKFKSLKIKDNLMKFMLKNKIILQYHYIPIYKFKVFKDKYLNKCSEHYYRSSISLPIYHGLKNKEQNKVIRLLIKFFKRI